MGSNRSLARFKAYLLNKKIYDRDFILKFTSNPDLNKSGLLTELWSNPDVFQKLNACFSIGELSNSFCEYSKKCIVQDNESEFVPSPYVAGHELVNWVRWMLKHHDSELLNEFVRWLEDFYRTYAHDQRISDCIVAGILEHLFENEEIRSKFVYWKDDPALSKAYMLAEEWIK